MEHGRQVGDVAPHGYEGNAQLRLGRMPTDVAVDEHAQSLEALQVGDDRGQLGPQAHVGVALRRRAVDGHPQQIQPGLDQRAAALFVQHGAVGDHLHPCAELLSLGHPLDSAAMDQRLADAAEIDRGHGVKPRQTIQDRVEGGLRHAAHGLVPVVAETGNALDVAGVGRLDVDFSQVVQWPVQAQAIGGLLDPQPGAGNQAQLGRHRRGQNQPALLVNLGPFRFLGAEGRGGSQRDSFGDWHWNTCRSGRNPWLYTTNSSHDSAD